MLRVRVLCPSATTARVLGLLSTEPGATHLTLTRGASLEPPGDLIEVDIARAAVDPILDALADLDLTHTGAITFGPVDAMLSDVGQQAMERRGGSTDTVVWHQVRSRAWLDSGLTPTFLAFLTIALLLAAVGVATASPITVVGAMVVGPEFGPLAALSVGLVRRDRPLIRRAARALALGLPIAMLITAAASLLWIRLGWISVGAVENARAFDFIYQVGPFSLVVALLAGAAGMLAQITARSAALVGVFISVTTVPAAGLAVTAAIAQKWYVAGSSLIQLAVNLIGIVIAGILVLLLRPGSILTCAHFTRGRA